MHSSVKTFVHLLKALITSISHQKSVDEVVDEIESTKEEGDNRVEETHGRRLKSAAFISQICGIE